ncbi:hypothetical protein [Mucilaginibacter ginkgonis]|uniref:Uncharacterized protein n=1 Tax=Mucilaginibacter ginkgonis TaxID=2682091 RepID=A0A7T7FB65_9SPHI|nr:hypothetical protein [Mucilaginibacter ginkgonis]QQL50129.1 hypothetical protein GO620_001375 [Mucilaginibacter ginkgonis]
MEDTIFLLVRVRIKTSYPSIHDAIAEVQSHTTFTIGSSDKVQVTEAQLIPLKTKK